MGAQNIHPPPSPEKCLLARKGGRGGGVYNFFPDQNSGFGAPTSSKSGIPDLDTQKPERRRKRTKRKNRNGSGPLKARQARKPENRNIQTLRITQEMKTNSEMRYGIFWSQPNFIGRFLIWGWCRWGRRNFPLCYVFLFSSLFVFFFCFFFFFSSLFFRCSWLFSYSPRGQRQNDGNLLREWGISLRPHLHRPR